MTRLLPAVLKGASIHLLRKQLGDDNGLGYVVS